MLDERLSAGDERFRKRAAQRMMKFADLVSILVLASHSVSLLQETCNKLTLWLDSGLVRMLGSVDDVLAAYQEAVNFA